MRGNFQTLEKFIAQIAEDEERKQDFIVNEMAMEDDRLLSFGGQQYQINDHAHGQIAQKLRIPKQYYDRMGEIPGLRSENVNAWLESEAKPRLVRTMGGTARAVLSDRYRAFDNSFVMQAVLPAIYEASQGGDNIRLRAFGLTESRMYFQLSFPLVSEQIRVGDVVETGLTITNSEVGLGRMSVEKLLFRLVCMNGMRVGSVASRNHVGRAIGEREEDYSVYRDDTIAAELESYRLRLRDVIRHALSGEELQKLVAPLRDATEQEFEALGPTVQNVTKRFSMTEVEADLVLQGVAETRDYTKYGLANSVTALAHYLDNMDRQYEVEGIGSQIINLSKKEWEEVAA